MASTVVEPTLWPWALGAVSANHLVLGGAGMLPRSRMLGPNVVRLPDAAAHRGEVALTFDDGPDPQITPAVLDVLDRCGMQASFFCIGAHAASYPDLVRDIARRGHSVENHTFSHPFGFACYPPAQLAQELARTQVTITALSGRAPAFFRPPMGLRSPLLDPVLSHLGLRHVSWTRRGYDAVWRTPERVLQRICRGLAGGDVLLLHDGHGARTREGQPVVLEVLPRLLDCIIAAGLRSVALPQAMHSAPHQAAQ